MGVVNTRFIAPHKPESLALDVLEQAKKPTAKAMFVCILHVNENGEEEVWYNHCGEMQWQVNWALDRSKAELHGWDRDE